MTIWDRLTKVVFVLLFVAAAALIFLSYLPLIRQNERMRQEVLRLETELERERALNRELMQSIEALRNDPKTVERLAREKLGLARPGETVVRFEEPATNAAGVRP